MLGNISSGAMRPAKVVDANQPGSETSALVNYLQLVGVGEDEAKIALSSFYDRYSEEFAALMRELALRAVARIRVVAPDDAATADFGILLERFEDVRLVDSTCHILKRLARDWAPSTSKKRPAGIKVHTVISLRDRLPVGDVSITFSGGLTGIHFAAGS